MKTRSAFVAAAALSLAGVALSLHGCGDDNGGGGNNTTATLTVDTLNVGLAGSFIPFEPERRAAVMAALAQNPADVVCLQEVWREEDKEAVATATRARFPHVVRARHDLNTNVEAEIDPMCTVPTVPTTPPCASDSTRRAMEAGIQCLIRNCSTMPGSEMGQTTSTDCARASCIGDVTNLLVSGAEGLRCYGCLAPNLPTETFASIRTQCTTNPRAGLAFAGQSGVMILSRHPITNGTVRVIPGNWNQRAIARATVTTPAGRRVEVYCNHLTPVFDNVAFPYTGRYGCGETNSAGWAREQQAQARYLIRYVNETAGTNPAVILGDFNSGPAIAGSGTAGVNAEAPEAHQALAMAFTPAVPAGYTPVCTFCGDNPLVGGGDRVWIDHIFVRNIPAGNVRTLQRTYDTATVTVPRAPGRVPISDHYGLRVGLTLP